MTTTLVAVGLSCVLGLIPVAAQDATPTTWWVSPALGTFGGLAVTTQVRSLVISVRGAFTPENSSDACDDCISGAGDIGLLLGFGTSPGRRWHFHAGAGLGLADYEDAPKAYYVSVPLQAELAWRPTGVLGLSVMGVGDVGFGGGSFGGIGAAVQLGRLR